MAMNPVELERKVRELDDDVQSIYVMLAGIQGTQERHTNRLNELAARLDVVNDEVGARIDSVGDRLGAVENRLEGVSNRLAAVENRLDEVLDLLRDRRG